MAGHDFTAEAQPIADQVMARCSCGWRKAVSLYEFDPVLAGEEARRLHAEHVAEARGEG